MMKKTDYYKVLEVDRDSSLETIKNSYRRMAMKYHPDRNPNDKKSEEIFKEVNEAYSVLSDTKKREAYDRLGFSAFSQGGENRNQPGFGFGSSFSDFFEGVFNDFMGGAKKSTGYDDNHSYASRGSDIRHDLNLSLEEANCGKLINITFEAFRKCIICDGRGSKSPRGLTKCSICEGRGSIYNQHGIFSIETACRACHGSGQALMDICQKCTGNGRIRNKNVISVSIPSGVDQDHQIKVIGEGDYGIRGGKAGDFYVFINIKSHKIFNREGSSLSCQVPLSIVTASLGGFVDIPLIDGGCVRISIPAGTQSGEQFRIREKGMAILRKKTKGDLIVEVKVETPVFLTDRQKNLLKEFESEDFPKWKSSPNIKLFRDKAESYWKSFS